MIDFDKEIKAEKKEIQFFAIELKKLLERVKYTPETNITQDVISRLDEPYMFVIVGEVKSGKSSFINALLDPGKTICKVAPSPMTDTIQQIVYGLPEREEFVSQFLKRIYQDNEILKEIAVVDTPGTNTIIEHHQEITEKFIPVSDLIIFVFEAKNPYRQSAWEFFDYVKDEWKKKVVFVLQQKDLMNSEDLAINFNGVKDYARKKNIIDPVVFAVSAKDEIEGQTNNSGFIELRQYIEKHITNGKATYLKLEASVDTLLNINSKLCQGMIIRKEQYEADLIFRHEIRGILDQQEIKTNYQTEVLIENLVAKYDNISQKYKEILSDKLGFFSIISSSFLSIFDKKENLSNWLREYTSELEKDLKDVIGKSINDGIKDIAENIQMMAKLVDAKLHNSKTILPNDHHIFSDLADKRANILSELIDTFYRFIHQEENFYNKEMLTRDSNVSPDLLKGSGLAAIGIVITALMHGVVFDITGGAITAIGFIFAGVGIGLKRNKILNGFISELEKGRNKIKAEVAEKVKNYVISIKRRIDDNFAKLDGFLENEEREIKAINEKQNEIERQFVTIKNDLISKYK
ncbi:MAG: dynamin family protein [Saprospiraceae bacterium]|nr:dynamin family protein [Saprospiraceae bacterium]